MPTTSPEWTTLTNREVPLTIVRQPPATTSPAETASTPGSLHGQLTWTPATFALFEAIRHRRFRQSLLLVEAGVDVNRRNDRGETPLIFTITHTEDSKTRDKFVRLLIEAGADPNAQDWRGLTALMHASLRGYTEVVALLLEHEKTDISIQDTDGNTALMYAACFGNADVISVFLSTYRTLRKALQLGQRNNHGLTALQLASKNKHEACIRLLTREGQQFPSRLQNEFPDLSDLDRAPTPTEERSTPQRMSKKQFDKKILNTNRTVMPPRPKVATMSSLRDFPETKDKSDLLSPSSENDLVAETEDLDLNSSKQEWVKTVAGVRSSYNNDSSSVDPEIRPSKPEPGEEILEENSRNAMDNSQALPRVRRAPAAPINQAGAGRESRNGILTTIESNSVDERVLSPPENAWRGPSSLANRLPLIPLRSLSRMQSAAPSKWKDQLDLDLLTNTETKRKMKSKSRLSETGSRSLSESREPCSEALQAVKEKPFGSSDRLQETLAEYWEQQLANWSNSSSSTITSVASSNNGNITDNFLTESRFRFEKDLVRLPPIRSSLSNHKKSLESSSVPLNGHRTAERDNNQNGLQ